MHRSGEEGVNEVLATILLVVLVVALAAVILSIALGWVVLQPKSAYIPPGVEVLDVGGEEVISLTSKGGDPAVLTPGNIGLYSLAIYLDTPGVRKRSHLLPGWTPGTRGRHFISTIQVRGLRPHTLFPKRPIRFHPERQNSV